ncbi:MAG: hypothetical protein AAGD00_06650 [Planctomycetota bacterium]
MVALGVERHVTQLDQETAEISRAGLIDRIQSLNPTAGAEYLATFGERDLSMYLSHLEAATEPRGVSSARWERPGDSPAICWAEACD